MKTCLIFSSLPEEDTLCNGSFVCIKFFNDHFYALTKFGKIYKLSNVNCSQSILNESVLNETLTSSSNLQCILNPSCKKTCNSLLVIDYEDTQMFIVVADKKIILYDNEDNFTEVSVDEKVKSLHNFDNYIVILLTSGQLYQICPYTKLILKEKNMDISIEDLLVLDSNSNEIELLVITKPDDDNDRSLKIIDYPMKNVKNELHMDYFTWLVKQPKCSLNLFYMSANKNENNLLYELEMKKVSETEPTQRLLKLIQRGHFDEAEEFAIQCELSLQPVYEARIRRICIDIGKQSSQTQYGQELSKRLFDLLEKIEDKQFLCSIADLEIPNRNLLERFLVFLVKRLNSTDYSSQLKRLNEKLLRIETLRLFDQNELYVQWREFVHHNNLKELCVKLFKTDFSIASLIWARHTSSILPYSTPLSIENMLKLIPNTVEPIEIINWLKHFVPSLLQALPDLMMSLWQFCMLKCKSLEFSNHWPEIGLEFMNNIKLIFNDVSFIKPIVQRKYDAIIENIVETIYALEDLSVLKKAYNLNIALDDYLRDAMEDTAYNILQRVQVSNLKHLVEQFLVPIFQEKGKNHEPTIKRYIKYLTINRNYTDWGERAVTSIELLHNEQDKLYSILMILKAAPVPWPEALNSLIKYGNTNHTLSEEIYTEYKNQNSKILRSKYGWPIDYVEFPGDRIIFIQRILKLKLPEMITDLRTVIDATPEIATEANFYIVKSYINEKKLDVALEYIGTLNNNERKNTCERLITTYVVSSI